MLLYFVKTECILTIFRMKFKDKKNGDITPHYIDNL